MSLDLIFWRCEPNLKSQPFRGPWAKLPPDSEIIEATELAYTSATVESQFPGR